MLKPMSKQGWTLYHVGTDKVVHEGDELTDFRGAKDILIDGEPPHKPGSTGRVYVAGGSYYPSVFNLRWRLSE